MSRQPLAPTGELGDAVRSHVRLLGAIARIAANKTPGAGEWTDQVTVDDSFLALARRHRLYPIASFALSRDPRIVVSPAVRGSLEQQHVRVAGRNLGLVSQLTQLLRVFDEHGIRAISFKGPVIAQSVYGSISRREFDDLDLIVGEDDLTKSCALLESCGYRPNARKSSVRQLALRLHHCVFVPTIASHVPVELHCGAPRWHFPVRSQVDDLFTRSAFLQLGGQPVRVPGAEDQVLLMCIHAASHAWTSLEHVLCLAVAIEVTLPSFSWPFLVEESRRVGAVRMLRLGLAMARRVCAATIDAGVERMVASDSQVERLSDILIRRLFEPRRPPAPQRILTHLRSLDSLTDRGRYAMRRMVTSLPFAGAHSS